MLAAQLGQEVEAVRARQREVEQHQRDVRMPREHRERLVAIAGALDRQRGIEVRQHLGQRVQDQRMVVHHEQSHGISSTQAQDAVSTAFAWRR